MMYSGGKRERENREDHVSRWGMCIDDKQVGQVGIGERVQNSTTAPLPTYCFAELEGQKTKKKKKKRESLPFPFPHPSLFRSWPLPKLGFHFPL